jgi:hypothetical protein
MANGSTIPGLEDIEPLAVYLYGADLEKSATEGEQTFVAAGPESLLEAHNRVLTSMQENGFARRVMRQGNNVAVELTAEGMNLFYALGRLGVADANAALDARGLVALGLLGRNLRSGTPAPAEPNSPPEPDPAESLFPKLAQLDVSAVYQESEYVHLMSGPPADLYEQTAHALYNAGLFSRLADVSPDGSPVCLLTEAGGTFLRTLGELGVLTTKDGEEMDFDSERLAMVGVILQKLRAPDAETKRLEKMQREGGGQ